MSDWSAIVVQTRGVPRSDDPEPDRPTFSDDDDLGANSKDELLKKQLVLAGIGFLVFIICRIILLSGG